MTATLIEAARAWEREHMRNTVVTETMVREVAHCIRAHRPARDARREEWARVTTAYRPLVEAAMDQPQPTPALRAALEAVLAVLPPHVRPRRRRPRHRARP